MLWRMALSINSPKQDAYPFLFFINAEGSHLMILRHSDVTVKQGWPGVWYNGRIVIQKKSIYRFCVPMILEVSRVVPSGVGQMSECSYVHRAKAQTPRNPNLILLNWFFSKRVNYGSSAKTSTERLILLENIGSTRCFGLASSTWSYWGKTLNTAICEKEHN